MTEISTFAQRFEYARALQRVAGTWQEDAALAEMLGIAASQISGYKTRDEAPPAKRTLALARACGVDPGWLAFGSQSAAPAPERFEDWLAKKRTPRGIRSAEPHVKAVPDRRARKKKPAKRASG